MDNKPTIDEGGEKASAGYEEKIASQQALLDDLKKDYQKNPSARQKLLIDRRQDTVLHLQTLAKGDPKKRAKEAADKARRSTITKAITQPLR